MVLIGSARHHLAVVDRDALGGERLLDVARGDRAEELVLFADLALDSCTSIAPSLSAIDCASLASLAFCAAMSFFWCSICLTLLAVASDRLAPAG